MELWHWHGDCRVNLAVVTYWYARPGVTDNFARVQPSDVLVQPMPVHLVPRVPGAIEGELLRILHVQGTTSIQDWDGLSGEKHLWWHEGIEPGHRLRASFDAPRDGRYRVMGHFLSARDYGVHQWAINDQIAAGDRPSRRLRSARRALVLEGDGTGGTVLDAIGGHFLQAIGEGATERGP
jgi:hypothetical protein